MEVDYKRDMSHSYLILKEEKEQNTSAYPIRMLVGNRIPSLLPCTIKGMNGEVLFYYEITSHQTLFSVYEKQKMSEEQLRGVLEGLVDGLVHMGEYLLNPDDLVLLPEYMYLDMDKGTLSLCYLPGYQKDIREQFRRISEYFLPKLDHKDRKAVALGYGIYRLAMDEDIQVDKIKSELYQPRLDVEDRMAAEKKEREKMPSFEEFQQQKEKEIIRQEAMNAFFQEDTCSEEQSFWERLIGEIQAFWKKHFRIKTKTEEKSVIKQPEDTNKIWEEYRDEYQDKNNDEEKEDKKNETTILYQAGKQEVSSLASKVPGKFPTIFLEKDMIVVGKLPVAADVLLESPTISRIHARISRRDGEYYLADLNSRNGTCVNGRILQGEEECLLKNYDEISFAEVQYVFLK